jgi:hypothetical protein
MKVGLLFSKDEVEALKRKTESGLPKKMWEIVFEGANSLLDSFTEEKAKEEVKKDLMSQKGKAIQAAFAYLITDDVRLADLAKRVCSFLLGMPSWKYPGGKHMDCGIGHSDYAREVAIVYDWIYDTLTEGEKQQLLDALIKKAVVNPSGGTEFADEKGARLLLRVVPTFSTKESFDAYHMEGSRNNWDANMTSALGVIGLIAKQNEWVEIAKECMNLYLEELMDENGCCKEGGGYYLYGVSTALPFLEGMMNILHENLYTEGLVRTADWEASLFSPTKEGIVTFHDSHYGLSSYFGQLPCILFKLASRGKSGLAQWFGEHIVEEAIRRKQFAGNPWAIQEAVLSIIWYDTKVKPVDPQGPSYTCHHKNGWVVLRSGWNRDATLFVFRSGPPTGAHTHLDNNSFMLEAYGERLVIETGVYSYEVPEYLTWDKATLSHNTIVVNGADQKIWRVYRSVEGEIRGTEKISDITHTNKFQIGHIREAPTDEATLYGGRISYYKEKEKYIYFIGDAAECYYGLERYLRHILYVKSGYFVIVDDLISTESSQFESRLHSNNLDGQGKIIVEGDMIRLIRPGATLLVKVVTPKSFNYTLGHGRLDGVDNKTNYISFSPKEKKYKDILFTVLFPVRKDDLEPAFSVTERTVPCQAVGVTIQTKHGRDVIEFRPEVGITFKHEKG